MTFTVQTICDAMDAWAPPSLAYDWDRVGLHVGHPAETVEGVLVCLSVTRAAYDAARDAGAQMIVSHHPLIWRPLSNLDWGDPDTRLCLDLAEARMACFAAHTNLDLARGGVNDVLADQLGLEDQVPLVPLEHARLFKLVTFVPEDHVARVREAVSNAGAGMIGAYTHCSFSAPGLGAFLPGDTSNPFSGEKGQINEEPEQRFETLVPKARLAPVLEALFRSHPYEEVAYDIVPLENRDRSVGMGVRGRLPAETTLDGFAQDVRQRLDLTHVRMIGDPSQPVTNVAVLGGAGGGEIGRLPESVDAFVTGDVKYHDACEALARGIAVIDAGHGGTEKGIVPVIAEYLRRQIDGLAVSTYTEPEIYAVVD